MKRQLIATFIVILMVTSVFTALAATTATPVGAATQTQTALSASKTQAMPGQSNTFTITLTKWNAATSSYVALASKNVSLYQVKGGTTTKLTTAKTDANGKVMYTVSYAGGNANLGARTYYAKFAGDSSYASSQSATVTVTVKYGTTLSLVRDLIQKPTPGQNVALWGYLKDQFGNPLSGKIIQFYWYNSTSKTYQKGATATTDSYGYYRNYGGASTPSTINYKTSYAGDSSYYWGSSDYTSITWKWQPQLSIGIVADNQLQAGDDWQSYNHAPHSVGYRGYLRDMNLNGINGKSISIYGRSSTTASWTNEGAQQTKYDGAYRPGFYDFGGKTVTPVYTQYTYVYFSGDSSYWDAKSNVVLVYLD